MPSTIHNRQTGEHITFLPDDGDVLWMRFAIGGGGGVAGGHFTPSSRSGSRL